MRRVAACRDDPSLVKVSRLHFAHHTAKEISLILEVPRSRALTISVLRSGVVQGKQAKLQNKALFSEAAWSDRRRGLRHVDWAGNGRGSSWRIARDKGAVC